MIQHLHETLGLSRCLLDQRRHKLRVDGRESRFVGIASHLSMKRRCPFPRVVQGISRIAQAAEIFFKLIPHAFFQSLIFEQIHLTDQIGRCICRLTFFARDIPVPGEDELMLGFLRLQRKGIRLDDQLLCHADRKDGIPPGKANPLYRDQHGQLFHFGRHGSCSSSAYPSRVALRC